MPATQDPVQVPLVPETWPGLVFTEAGRQQLVEIVRFLEHLHAHGVPEVEAIEGELRERLDYLEGFGGQVSDTDARRRFRITLGRDWAPLSFTLTWEQWTPSVEAYRLSMTGALIWHGGSNDPLCVSLTPQLWGIHT